MFTLFSVVYLSIEMLAAQRGIIRDNSKGLELVTVENFISIVFGTFLGVVLPTNPHRLRISVSGTCLLLFTHVQRIIVVQSFTSMALIDFYMCFTSKPLVGKG